MHSVSACTIFHAPGSAVSTLTQCRNNMQRSEVQTLHIGCITINFTTYQHEYIGRSKSLCTPDDCTVIVRCTKTFWSPCTFYRQRQFITFPNYYQQAATFLNLFISLYMFQAVPPPIIRSTKLHTQLQVLSTNTVSCCYRGWDGTSIRKHREQTIQNKCSNMEFHLIHDRYEMRYMRWNIVPSHPRQMRWDT